MPRPNPGPRLILFGPDTKHGAKPRKGFTQYIWYIVWSERRRPHERSTGASFEHRAKAEGELGDFLNSRALKWNGARRPDQVTIADVLAVYGEEHAPTVEDPGRIAYCITALVLWWTDQYLSAITPRTCRAYVKSRVDAGMAAGTARKELGTLIAAINYCVAEGKLTQSVPVELPPKSPSKDIWLDRTEIATLVVAARRQKKAKAHLPYFILIGFYMGRRKQAILKLQWQANPIAGHVDLPGCRIDFQGRRAVESKKRKGRAEIPRRLLTLLRYLRKRTTSYVLEYEGSTMKNLKRSFRTACEEATKIADKAAAKATSPMDRDQWIESARKLRLATPHTLRHSCASWLVQRGLPYADVGQFIDMSGEMVERTYGHLAPGRNERVLKAMEQR
jgi:integrase